MAHQNLTIVRGDTFSFGIEIEGLNQDLDSAYFTCKANYTDDINVFQKSLGNGITRSDTGRYVVRIAPEDTAELEPGKYFYDFVIGANGDIFTVLIGMLDLIHNVTVKGVI